MMPVETLFGTVSAKIRTDLRVSVITRLVAKAEVLSHRARRVDERLLYQPKADNGDHSDSSHDQVEYRLAHVSYFVMKEQRTK